MLLRTAASEVTPSEGLCKSQPDTTRSQGEVTKLLESNAERPGRGQACPRAAQRRVAAVAGAGAEQGREHPKNSAASCAGAVMECREVRDDSTGKTSCLG